MSNRRAKARRRMGHPARVAGRDGASKSRQGASATSKSRQGASATKGLVGKSPRSRRTRRPPRRRSRPPWLTALASRIQGAWLALLKARPVAAPRAPRRDGRGLRRPLGGARPLTGAARGEVALVEFSRTDFVWAAATGGAAAALFATALTSHPALADAAEAVTGVSSLGILHAPGYISYVLAAKAFTLLVPFGSEAFRVNLFSLVCASLSIAGVQLLARRCGASRWAASVGALTLAAGAGFWFYAGFAKHDMFSGLMFLVALHLTLAWQQRPRTGKLIALAAGARGRSGGILAPDRVAAADRGLRTVPRAGPALAPVARCGDGDRPGHPGRAWRVRDGPCRAEPGGKLRRRHEPLAARGARHEGGLHSARRSDQAELRRHRLQESPPANATGASSASSPRAPSGAVAAAIVPASGVPITTGLGNYVVVFARELGIVGLALSALGLILSLRRRRTTATWPLLIAFAANLIGADLLVRPGGSNGTDLQLIEEGFVLGCYFVLATWLALGATELVAGVSGLRLRSGASLAAHRKVIAPLAAAVVAGVLLVPSILGHWSVAHRAGKPYADRLASAVFAELPRGAAVFVSNSELADPLVYQQVVKHRRRDMLVVDMFALEYRWYREELERRLGRPLPPLLHDSVLDAREVAKWLNSSRPVYMDLHGAQVMAGNDTSEGLNKPGI